MGRSSLIHNRLEDTPKSPTPPAVIYDPKMSRDSLVVEKILKPIYPEIRILEVPYSGHTVLVSLGEYGLLKQVIRSLVEDNVLLSPELPTETSAIWLRQRAKEIKRKNPAKAKAMLVRSLDMRPSKDTASVLLSLLIKLGDMKEAKVLIDAQSKGKKRPGRICSVRASSGSGEQLGLRCLSPRMEMTIGQLALTSRSSGTGIAARRSPSSPRKPKCLPILRITERSSATDMPRLRKIFASCRGVSLSPAWVTMHGKCGSVTATRCCGIL